MIHQIYKTNCLEGFHDGRSDSMFVLPVKKGFEVDYFERIPRRLSANTGHRGGLDNR